MLILMFLSCNRNGSLKVDFRVIYRSKTPTTKIVKVVLVIETLKRETKNRTLGKFIILPQSFEIKGK